MKRDGTYSVHPRVRKIHEALFTHLTGIPCEWIPTGVVCETCDGQGFVETHRLPYVLDPTLAVSQTFECEDCLDGAVACRVCGERPATLKLTDPDGEVYAICHTPSQACFEYVREWLVGSGRESSGAPDGVDAALNPKLVDIRAGRA